MLDDVLCAQVAKIHIPPPILEPEGGFRERFRCRGREVVRVDHGGVQHLSGYLLAIPWEDSWEEVRYDAIKWSVALPWLARVFRLHGGIRMVRSMGCGRTLGKDYVMRLLLVGSIEAISLRVQDIRRG